MTWMQLGEHFGALLRIPLYDAERGSVDALFTVQRGEEEGRSFLLLESHILKLLVTFKLNTWENNVRNPSVCCSRGKVNILWY